MSEERKKRANAKSREESGGQDGSEGRKGEGINVWIDNNSVKYYCVEDATIIDGIEDEMLSDLKAEEDELLHGENCWT